MYFTKAISLAIKMLASRRPFRLQVKPTTFPMMLCCKGNSLLTDLAWGSATHAAQKRL